MEIYEDDLCHSGIQGMKWHRRRYQYPDGSLTPAGRIRYAKKAAKAQKAADKASSKARDAISKLNGHAASAASKHNAGEPSGIAKMRYNMAMKKAQKASEKAVKKDAAKQKIEKPDPANRLEMVSRYKTMSDDDLTKAIARLNLEKNYKELFATVNPPPKHVETGKEMLGKALKQAGTKALANVVQTTSQFIIGELVDTVLGKPVNNKPKDEKKDKNNNNDNNNS